jgi:hypothetical protein
MPGQCGHLRAGLAWQRPSLRSAGVFVVAAPTQGGDQLLNQRDQGATGQTERNTREKAPVAVVLVSLELTAESLMESDALTRSFQFQDCASDPLGVGAD